jgi:hypothetical protein
LPSPTAYDLEGETENPQMFALQLAREENRERVPKSRDGPALITLCRFDPVSAHTTVSGSLTDRLPLAGASFPWGCVVGAVADSEEALRSDA